MTQNIFPGQKEFYKGEIGHFRYIKYAKFIEITVRCGTTLKSLSHN